MLTSLALFMLWKIIDMRRRNIYNKHRRQCLLLKRLNDRKKCVTERRRHRRPVNDHSTVLNAFLYVFTPTRINWSSYLQIAIV